jgi:hypothetical protein
MIFSNYYLYVEQINHADYLIGMIAGMTLFIMECLYLVKLYKPGLFKLCVWLAIGGFYASLLVLASSGVAGA